MAEERSKELDARDLLAFSGSIHSSLIASSIAIIIGSIAFGITGADFFDLWEKLLPIVALTFAGTYLGTAIGHGIEVRMLRKRFGARPLGQREG